MFFKEQPVVAKGAILYSEDVTWDKNEARIRVHHGGHLGLAMAQSLNYITGFDELLDPTNI